MTSGRGSSGRWTPATSRRFARTWRRARAAGPEADRVAARKPRRERRRWGGWPAPLVRLRPIPAALLASVLLAVGVAGGIVLSGGDETTTTKGFGPRGTQVALHVTGDHGTLDLSGMPAPP